MYHEANKLMMLLNNNFTYDEKVGRYDIYFTLETKIDALILHAQDVYTIGFHGEINPELPSFSLYNLL